MAQDIMLQMGNSHGKPWFSLVFPFKGLINKRNVRLKVNICQFPLTVENTEQNEVVSLTASSRKFYQKLLQVNFSVQCLQTNQSEILKLH